LSCVSGSRAPIRTGGTSRDFDRYHLRFSSSRKGGLTSDGGTICRLLFAGFPILMVMLSTSIAGMIGMYFMIRAGEISLPCGKGSPGKTIMAILSSGRVCAARMLPAIAADATRDRDVDAALGIAGFMPGIVVSVVTPPLSVCSSVGVPARNDCPGYPAGDRKSLCRSPTPCRPLRSHKTLP
jgi:hypothetical protein